MFRFHECPECHQRNPQGSGFCVGCGSTLQRRFCLTCGYANDVQASTCRACGAATTPIGVGDQSIFAPATSQSVTELDAIFGRSVVATSPKRVDPAPAVRAGRATRPGTANADAAAQTAKFAPNQRRHRRRIALVPILIAAAVGGAFVVHRLQPDPRPSTHARVPDTTQTAGATMTAIGAATVPATAPAAGWNNPVQQPQEMAPATTTAPDSTPTDTAPAAGPTGAPANPTPATSVTAPVPTADAPSRRAPRPAAAAVLPDHAAAIRAPAKQPCTAALAALALCSADSSVEGK